MKKIITLVLLGLMSQMAIAHSFQTTLIENIVQSGNLMPGPGKRFVVTTTIGFRVVSNGCTEAKDFSLKTFQTPRGQEVLLERTREDTCEAAPHLVSIELSTSGLRWVQVVINSKGKSKVLNPVYLANPLRVKDETVH